MTRYRVRRGKQSDIPRLSEIERDAAQRFNDIDGYRFCATGAIRDVPEFLRGLEDGALLVGITVGAVNPCGAVAGFALLWRIDSEAHLTELNVERRHQGNGLGRMLIAEAEAWARRQGFSAMTLTTFRDVPWNMPFYRRLGFVTFEAGPERHGLAAIAEDERVHGFRAKPRVEMRKLLIGTR